MSDCLDTLNTAISHHMAGRIVAAESLYRRVLDADAEHPSALYLFGVLNLATDRVGAAVGLLERVVRLRPEHAEGRFALANARYRQGDRTGAIAGYRAVLALEPGHEGARVNLARTLRESGDPPAALALLAAPRTAREWVERAAAYLADRQDVPCVAAAECALELEPDCAEAWFISGTARGRLRHFPEAIAALRRAIAAAPNHAEARLNLGNVLLDCDRPEEAEASIRAAIDRDPTLKEAHASLGFLLACAGRIEEAIAACQAAIRCDPGFAQAHWNQAVAHLIAGDFAPGWEKYEWRKRHEFFGSCFRRMEGPYWEGEDLAGQTLLVLAEQGYGDTIQFCRYLPMLQARGARVVLACAPVLQPLLAGMTGLELADRDGDLPEYDLWVDQMSLPRLFGTRIDNVPCPEGYLRADPARVAAMRARLPAGTRVGLVWAGNPGHSNDRRRSTSFASLAPLLAVEGVTFVNLQVGPTRGDAAGSVLFDPGELTDYAQTAAVVANLNLVITVDTSVCHLAGALGVPAWVMLPHVAEWRWMLDRTDTPWYHSLRLFRQPRAGAWADLISEVSLCLRARCHG